MRRHLTLIKALFVLVLALTFAGRVVQAQQTCAPNSLYPPGTSPAPFFNGLVAWWPATENSLETICPGAGCPGYNDIIGGNNGTPAGGVSFASGEVGQAFSFNGADASISVPDSPALELGTSDITVDFWLNTTQPSSSFGPLLWKSTCEGPCTGWGVFTEDGGGGEEQLGIQVCDPNFGCQQWGVLSTTANNGQWHLLAFTRSGTTLAAYLDGANDTTVITNPGVANPTNGLPLVFGTVAGPLFYSGLLDEVQIFNRSLSTAEIQAIYNAGRHGLCPQAHFGNPTAIPPVPTLMGVSIGNTTGTPSACSKATPCASGTAGLLVYSTSNPSQEFILSSNHVLSAVGPTFCPGTAAPGTWTLQPGTGDLGSDPGNNDSYHVASFSRGLTNFDIDAGLSQLVDPTYATTAIFGIGQPNPHVGVAKAGEPVIKSGETTAVTIGGVEDVNWTGFVKVSDDGECPGAYFFRNQISISSSQGKFSGPGDSGSAVLDTVTRTPVGLLMAGYCSKLTGHCVTLANPINKVYVDLGVFPESSTGAGPKTQRELKTEVQVSNTSVDPRLVRLEEIQSRHEDEVLRIPGLQGIGIGLDENGQDLVFHVYVIKQTAALTAAVPQAIEGVPVRFVETGGEFRLL